MLDQKIKEKYGELGEVMVDDLIWEGTKFLHDILRKDIFAVVAL
jgi:hypothetical protein